MMPPNSPSACLSSTIHVEDELGAQDSLPLINDPNSTKTVGESLSGITIGSNVKQHIDEFVAINQGLCGAEATRKRLPTLLHMVLSSGALMVSLLAYAYLQEMVMTIPGASGDHFHYTPLILIVNRLVTVCFVGIVMVYRGDNFKRYAPLASYGLVAVSTGLASYCQYLALDHVSFPTQVLAKSSKPIAVMCLGMLVHNRKYSHTEKFIACVVALSVAAFVFTGDTAHVHNHNVGDVVESKEAGGAFSITFSSHVLAKYSTTTFIGVVMMLMYLIGHGFAVTLQETLFLGFKSTSLLNHMFYINAIGVLLAVVLMIGDSPFTVSAVESLAMLRDDPLLRIQVFNLAMCSAASQVAVYFVIKSHGGFFYSTVVTLRQMVTLLLSCFLFGHRLTVAQTVVVIVMFLALYGRVLYAERQNHIRANKEVIEVRDKRSSRIKIELLRDSDEEEDDGSEVWMKVDFHDD